MVITGFYTNRSNVSGYSERKAEIPGSWGGGINKILKMGGEPIIRGFVNKWGSGLTHLQTICEFMGQESLQ